MAYHMQRLQIYVQIKEMYKNEKEKYSKKITM